MSESGSAVVVDTSRSPNAMLRPVGVRGVTLRDAFWAPRLAVNQSTTLAAQHRLLEETGRLDNLRRVAGASDAPFVGRYFNDSDVYKWQEAASWALAYEPDPALAGLLDGTIAVVAAAQRDDGYLDSYFELERAGERWTQPDLHELYCAGHLFQAAVAHHRATGSRSLLDVATRLADHIRDRFGPAEEGKTPWTDGHPEVELALVELARETGERRYLDQARFFAGVRGTGVLDPPYEGRWSPEYHQDHLPVREQAEIVGHAVRAVYLNAGVADLCLDGDEPELRAAMDRLWASMTQRKLYVTGGIGARHDGEAFGDDYELPNATAYAETCASIGATMWAWRMLALTGEARYADLMERELYNGILSGLALDGTTYFYENPLADEGEHRRQPWFGTACCPPNLARLLPSLPGYVAATSDDSVWLHLYATSTVEATLPDGQTARLHVETSYPWDGDISIEIETAGEWTLHLRLPGWVGDGSTLEVAGEAWPGGLTPGSYVVVGRRWSAGDVVRLHLPMPVRRLSSHPRVTENAGRVALMRGPLVYCLEAVDNPGIDVRDVVLPRDAAVEAEHRPELLGGVTVLTYEGRARSTDTGWDGALYRDDTVTADQTTGEVSRVTAVPYYAWANRAPGPMRVWIATG